MFKCGTHLGAVSMLVGPARYASFPSCLVRVAFPFCLVQALSAGVEFVCCVIELFLTLSKALSKIVLVLPVYGLALCPRPI